MKRKNTVFILAVIIAISFIGMIQNYLGVEFELALLTWVVAILIAGYIHYFVSTITWNIRDKEINNIKNDIELLKETLSSKEE